jgi:hypothetical protein
MEGEQMTKDDWVVKDGEKVLGLVKRVAKDLSWAEVKWSNEETVKRIPTIELKVITTIPVNPEEKD